MDLKDKKILVIEDDKTIRNNVFDYLVLQDIEVQTAKNGIDGLSVYELFKPDLILCDIMMPEMDGITFFMELNRLYPSNQSLFIFLTAKNNPEDIRKGLDLGADDYVIKPFLFQTLWETIKGKFEKAELQNKSYADAIQLKSIKANSTPFQEFNTCLNDIIGGSHVLLKSNKWGQETSKILDGINSGGIRLYKAINNLIFFNSVLQSVAKIQVEFISDNMLQSFLLPMSTKYKRRDDLIVTFVGNGGVNTDRFMLKKLIEELLDNAFKYTSSGEKLYLSFNMAENKFDFSLTYRVGSFNLDRFNEVNQFKQFSKENSVNEGLGLGLFLAKKIAIILGADLLYKQVDIDRGEFSFHLTKIK
jgi:CheY-like chemotaxis protein